MVELSEVSHKQKSIPNRMLSRLDLTMATYRYDGYWGRKDHQTLFLYI